MPQFVTVMLSLGRNQPGIVRILLHADSIVFVVRHTARSLFLGRHRIAGREGLGNRSSVSDDLLLALGHVGWPADLFTEGVEQGLADL